MPLATLTSKGQIVIPKVIRDRLELHAGDQVDFVLQKDGSVILRPATEDVLALSGALFRPGQRTVTLEEMQEAIVKRASRAR